jgi:hypothetical protein
MGRLAMGLVCRRRRAVFLGPVTVLLVSAMTAIAPASPMGSRACGSFSVPLLRPRVDVNLVRGRVGCSTATAVMRWTYASDESSFVRHHDGWTIDGPQTLRGVGYGGRERRSRVNAAPPRPLRTRTAAPRFGVVGAALERIQERAECRVRLLGES